MKNIDVPMLRRVWQELEYHIDVSHDTPGAHRISIALKKTLSFPVAVNNSINVGHLVSLLQMFVNTENIMKPPVCK